MNFLSKNKLLQTVWVQKRFLEKSRHLNCARKHTESTRWRTICTRGFYRHRKSIWHCKSWYTAWKLNHYGTRGISNDWLRSYLSDTTQFVSINVSSSDYKTVKYGVPQGSVLGLLLFLIFINDLNIQIKNSTSFHFADDTCLLNIKDSIKNISKEVNKNFQFLIHRLHANKFSLNVAKTEVIIFRRKKKQLDFYLNLKICGKKTPSIKLRKISSYTLR